MLKIFINTIAKLHVKRLSVFHNSWVSFISLDYLTCFMTSLTWYSGGPIFSVDLGLQPHNPRLNLALMIIFTQTRKIRLIIDTSKVKSITIFLKS